MSERLNGLKKILMNNTVLENWFSPLKQALEKVRYSDKKYPTLNVSMFLLINCVRQLNPAVTLREHIQRLFHIDDEALKVPLARSTYSDALANEDRLAVTQQACTVLYESARQQLPDRLSGIKGIEGREVYAMDGTYQRESCHFTKVTPSDGGTDSPKGHLQMTVFDLRAGLPFNTDIDTSSISEIRFIKERWGSADLTTRKNSLWVVDRGFIDATYWDLRKSKYNVTSITRMKSNLNYTVLATAKITSSNKKQGIKKDQLIQLNSSTQQWRLMEYKSDSGETYQYLTNDLTLASGVVAFLYHRRWDEEKYFDNYKNDMANAKAWGKSKTAIKHQAILGMITFILTRLFSHKYAKEFNLPTDGSTQNRKQKKKLKSYLDGHTNDKFRAFQTNLSKVTRQVWRFLKECMLKKSRPKLYENQLRPLMTAYL